MLVAVVDCDFAVGVAGAVYGFALVELHEVAVSEAEVRVVEVTLLNVVDVHEFGELSGG